jgi:hypothetical protein
MVVVNAILRGKIAMKRLAGFALAPLLLLVACDARPNAPPNAPKQAEPTPAPSAPSISDAAAGNFQHDAKLDVFGYYFAEPTVKSGNWELASLNMGSPEDFTAWEAGERPGAYAPIFLEFEDVTSPTAQNELGGTYHTISVRLRPDSYQVDAQAVVFRGKDARIGEVSFSGAFDLEALKAAKSDADEDKVVLRGKLRIGAGPARAVVFTYFAGD